MKAFFNELLEYTFHFNDKVIDSLIASTEIPEKSLRLLNHTINAQQIWNARIEKKPLALGVWEMRETALLKGLNSSNYENSMRIVAEYDFNKKIRYTNSKGQVFENTVRDMLFHIVNHSTYHRGQIATDCKLHGMEPLATDYIFYKRD